MKFPFIIFFRHDQYSYTDNFFIENKVNLDCSVYITNNVKKIKKLHNANFHLLITYGASDKEYNNELLQVISEKMFVKRLHLPQLLKIETFNKYVNMKYIANCALSREFLRPTFSLFTPSFNSYHKILRVYNSLKEQTLKDWEWIIIDDSPDDKHFQFLRKNFQYDNRIRFYRHSQNNGSIGNVKNEAVSLCRGKYVLEMDHDDEILPDVLQDAANLFDSNQEVGFIYMDFICVYESGENQWYGDFICKGYGGYYSMKYKDKWRLVYITPNINNITLSHLVCCPNHPRIWRREFLLELGNYCENLHICDDYEILLRTAISHAESYAEPDVKHKKKYKMAKIHKLGYIQYMNEGENNFSLIRNAEINRIGPNFISPIYYKIYNIHEKMKQIEAHEDETYVTNHSKIWLRDSTTYTNKYCNLLVNINSNYQICIIGYDSLLYNLERIKELYENENENSEFQYDFILLDNKCSNEYLWSRLDYLKLDKIKCYTLIDHTNEELTNYFKLMYLSTEKYEIIDIGIKRPKYNTLLNNRHEIINQLTNKDHTYLEIGVEKGYTFNNVHFLNKTGVDPDPKFSNKNIHKETSDEYFKKCIKSYDVIFIDGMHLSENVLRDFNNSIKFLNENGTILIDDIIPLNYNEQLTIPLRHYYENGILKYGEEWTGDVWKTVYYLLVHYQDKLSISYYYNINYRGIAHIKLKNTLTIFISKKDELKILEEINQFDYFKDFNKYLLLLTNK
jgi:glycosyltransferase involved in cell wall biosynthesis